MSYHGCFFGETGSGKTFKARQLAGAFKAGGVPVLSFVPPGHRWTEAAWQSSDLTPFLDKVNRSRRCAVFIEFSDAEVAKFDAGVSRLFTWSRNFGHRCFCIAQRHTQISPTIRDQCSRLWLFRVGQKTADLFAEEFVDPTIRYAPNLPDYHFILKKRGAPASFHKPA